MRRERMLVEFLRVRSEVDSDNLLDGYDFALGWLLGRGVSPSTACEWIDAWADAGSLTWPLRERMKADEEDARRRAELIGHAIKRVTE